MQALAIAMVIVGGVGIFIMSLSTLDFLIRNPRKLLPRSSFRPGICFTQARTIVIGTSY